MIKATPKNTNITLKPSVLQFVYLYTYSQTRCHFPIESSLALHSMAIEKYKLDELK